MLAGIQLPLKTYHMCTNNLYDPLQSAYRSQHSTETAILKIHNDIIEGLDAGKCTVLSSLDLSAAFDTVDHTICIRRLSHLYGVDGTVLQWFKSFLSNRDNKVCVNDVFSLSRDANCGVPQGSVLGARLYTMYVYPLTTIIRRHGLQYHTYADDTQIYLQCDNHHDAINAAITRDDSTLLSEIEVVDIGLCNDQGVVLRDQYAISCKIQLEITSPKYQRVSFRNFRNIDVNIFRQSIKKSPSLNNTYGTLDELTDRYITDLTSLLDVHAPLQQRLILLRPHSPWYNENLRNAKRVRRKLERVWRTHGREPDRLAYRHQCGIVAQLLTSAKTKYYTTKVEECRGDQKALSRLTNNLFKKQMTQLPSAESNIVLANTFGNFFSDKISNIRSSINNTHPDQTLLPLTTIKFSELRLTNSAEIRNVIKSCNNSSCQLDPIPTWLTTSTPS